MNTIFVESENYFKSLTILDFEIKSGVLANVNYKVMVTDKEEMLKACGLTKFDDEAAENI